MTLTEKYLETVKKYLPSKLRKDVLKELDDLITQEIESGKSEETVLLEFGDPRDVAKEYAPQIGYLIEPKLRFIYYKVLTIVLIAVLIGLSVANLVSFMVGDKDVLSLVLDLLSGYLFAGLNIFGMITLIFMLINRYVSEEEINEDIKEIKKEAWSINKLKDEQEKKQVYMTESIFSIVFSLIFISLILFAINTKREFIINLEIINRYSVFIVIVFAINIIFEFSLIVKRKWTKSLRTIKILIEILTSGFIIFVISRPDFINMIYFNDLTTWPDVMIDVVNNIPLFAIVLIAVLTIYEIIKQVHRILKDN